jgi:hypothetical protein
VALAVAGFAIWFFVFRDTGSSGEVHGPAGAPFTVDVPSGWDALPAEELTALPGSPLAVIRQIDDTGVVIVNSQPQTDASLSQLSEELQKKLKDKIPDFQLVGAETIKVRAGEAISISYARTKTGTANTLLVVPAGDRIYTLNSVVPAGQNGAAREASEILRSFDA